MTDSTVALWATPPLSLVLDAAEQGNDRITLTRKQVAQLRTALGLDAEVEDAPDGVVGVVMGVTIVVEDAGR